MVEAPCLLDPMEYRLDQVALGKPKIRRHWAMPSHETFSIPPVRALLERLDLGQCVVDPFARNSEFAPIWSNDLNLHTTARYTMHAEAFADMLIEKGVKATSILFDPPYSYRQCREVYESHGLKWLKDDQQQVGRWARLKDKLASVLLPGGLTVSFGWSTTGFGKKRGFKPLEYLMINHGSAHNDTLCVVECSAPQRAEHG